MNVEPINIASMPKTKKCAYCGKVFTTNSGMQKYCSEECAEQAKESKAIGLQQQEYLTFSKAAILLGCTRQYVYKLVEQGKLPASRLSSRMALVRKSDIEKMFAVNPYHRVMPGASLKEPDKKPSHLSSSSSSKKGKNQIGESPMRYSETLDYISGEDVMAIYKVKKSWLYASAKRNNIPMCKIAGKNYYSRKHMDELFGVSAEIESLTEWLTTEEAETLYSTTRESLRSQVYRRHIPTKREYGKTYYSKTHLDEIYHPDLKESDTYYTTAEAAEKYGMTKSNICIIVKTNNLTKVKVGVQNLIVKEEIEKVMANRLAKFGSYRIQ